MILRDKVIQVQAPLVEAGYGNQARDWGSGDVSRTPRPADVQPVSSTEDVVNQQQTVTRWRMVLYPNQDVEPTDRFEWDGDTYEVDGDVERHKRRGTVRHLTVVLMRVEQGA